MGRENIIGQKFGILTVESLHPQKSKSVKRSIWNCHCDCGKKHVVRGKNLKSGAVKSCGCLNHRKGKESASYKDRTGAKSFMLTDLGYDKDGSRKHDQRAWYQCDCGIIKSINKNSVITGNIKSCGCLHRRQGIQNPGFIDLTGQRFGAVRVRRFVPRPSTKKQGTFYEVECDCGTIWIVNGSDVRARDVLSCGCAKRGHGEELVRAILEKRTSKKWITVRKVLGGLELDCYNEEFKAAVEYNGQQHYEYISKFFHPTKRHFLEQQKRDAKKVKLCSTKGIKLLIIKYLPDFSPKNVKQMESKIVNFLRENKILTKGD